MDEVKHRSRKGVSEKKESSKRNGEKHRDRKMKSSDSDEKYIRDKHREREKDRSRDDDDMERRHKKRKDGDREDREREKKRKRELGRERERERRLCEKEKHREVDSDDSKNDTHEHDRKRRRRHNDYKEREHETSSNVNMRRDGSADIPRMKIVEDDLDRKEKKTQEKDLEDEQLRLDGEMEKRRRRVQEWQELRKKTEEFERGKCGEANAEEPKSIDREVENAMPVDGNNRTAVSASQNGVEEDEIDPLDAFMNSMVLPEVEKLNKASGDAVSDPKCKDTKDNEKYGPQPKRGSNKSIGKIIPGENSDSDYGDLESDSDSVEDEDGDKFIKSVKKTKAEKLNMVDHSKMDYQLFRKNFYVEVKEISSMTSEEVAAYRKQLELKTHGKDVPKPIKTWNQTGFTTRILETIKKLNFENPMPIQAQALPIIMSGRDCIGMAKTGSGKTLAFVLPMLRHIKNQPPVMAGDGPIGLIIAPTRELVQQIYRDIKKFARVLGLRCVPVYGGSGVAQQISELKRGAEIVVCTPGRMIDILCTSGGKITNLCRVTYLVMDEADRMFDMGFEPQITRIVQNIRPDRQTVLFSATFPRQVEILAHQVLTKPVQIQVGGRSVVNNDINQMVEIIPESDKFGRMLELLAEWGEKGKTLIFVRSQEKCDALFKDLLKQGFPCLSLHGAKDQTYRESTLSDFKSNICNLMVATSVASRGLDVKDLELVVNYDVPNYYEDYVHRVGRTGRAGRKGCAITFLSEGDERYAPDLVKALELSGQVVPDGLGALANGFKAKVKQGLEQAHGTGYGGRGFKFNEEEEEVRKAAKKAQAKEYGIEVDTSDSEHEEDGGDLAAINPTSTARLLPNGGLPVSVPSGAAAVVPGTGLPVPVIPDISAVLAKIHAGAMPKHFKAELEINDLPQNARWKVTRKETLNPISDWTGAAITTKGQYLPPGKLPVAGAPKLYLCIEGPSMLSVNRAKADLKRVLEDITNQASSFPGGARSGKYSVI